MASLGVSLQDIFEISYRKRDGGVNKEYCGLLEDARKSAVKAVDSLASEISIEYYTSIVIDPAGKPIKPSPEHRFGEIHFNVNELLSTGEGVLAASRERATQEVDEYMKLRDDADSSH